MTHERSQQPGARRLVTFSAAFFLAFGIESLLFPESVAKLVDIQLNSPSALADLRAMYGGCMLAMGAFMLMALRDARMFDASLWLIGASLGAAAGSRLYSVIVSGVPNGLVLTALGLELVGLAYVLYLYRRPTRSVLREARSQHA